MRNTTRNLNGHSRNTLAMDYWFVFLVLVGIWTLDSGVQGNVAAARSPEAETTFRRSKRYVCNVSADCQNGGTPVEDSISGNCGECVCPVGFIGTICDSKNFH